MNQQHNNWPVGVTAVPVVAVLSVLFASARGVDLPMLVIIALVSGGVALAAGLLVRGWLGRKSE